MKKHLESLRSAGLHAGAEARRTRMELSEQDLERVTAGWGCPFYIDSGAPIRHLGYAEPV